MKNVVFFSTILLFSSYLTASEQALTNRQQNLAKTAAALEAYKQSESQKEEPVRQSLSEQKTMSKKDQRKARQKLYVEKMAQGLAYMKKCEEQERAAEKAREQTTAKGKVSQIASPLSAALSSEGTPSAVSTKTPATQPELTSTQITPTQTWSEYLWSWVPFTSK